MKSVMMKSFNEFRCTAENCTDNCCIGWEIDIDDETLDYYKSIKGGFGRELNKNISVSQDGAYCFCLKENGRCAFLNENNLCEIIKNLGEDSLCEICSEHPRFYNFLYNYEEAGLGLCCEEAARLLLSADGFTLCEEEFPEDTAEITKEEALIEEKVISARNKMLYILNRRENSLNDCIKFILSVSEKLSDDFKENKDYKKEYSDSEVLLLKEKEEPVDEKYLLLIEKIKQNLPLVKSKEEDFKKYRSGDEDYKKILAYMIFRHFSSCIFDGKVYGRLMFCILNLRFIELADILTYAENNGFSLADRINNVKYWSRQTEYSDINTELYYNL